METLLLDFRFREVDREFLVRATIGDDEPGEYHRFAVDLSDNSRFSKLVREIERGRSYRLEDIQEVGSQLWGGLLTDNEVKRCTDLINEQIAGGDDFQCHIRLALPPELSGIPWETLCEERTRKLFAEDTRYSVYRCLPENFGEPLTPREEGPLRVLVAIPEGSGLDVNAEWGNISRALTKAGVVPDRLEGHVHLEALDRAIRTGKYDILHFVGHGDVDDEDRVSIRLNPEDQPSGEVFVHADMFAALFTRSSIRLAFLNCCQGGRSTSGLGPALLHRGIPAVVAMQYEIVDPMAIKFSDNFYGHLASGDNPGNIAAAVQWARRAVFLSQRQSAVRSFVTPVLFMAEVERPLFELEAPQVEPQPPPPPPPAAEIDLPHPLVSALKDCRCIPVLGPGYLNETPPRAAREPPGPLHVARLLAGESDFPDMGEFDVVEKAGDWYSAILLQRVCQHYQKTKSRPELVYRLQEIYGGCDIPDSLSALVRWRAPGVFLTHFDGLMSDACDSLDQEVRVVSSVAESIDVDEQVPMLVHLRGILSHEDSLVLTEEDYDGLHVDLTSIASQIAELASPFGRCLLFLGVSPRDFLIRRLCHELLPTDRPRRDQSVFFACDDPSAADNDYWQRFDVQWIPGNVHDLIAALSHVVMEPRE